MRLTHRLSRKVRELIRRAIDWLKGAWAAHRRLLRGSRAYEAAMAAAAAQMIIQTSWERFAGALVSGLLDVYATVRRITGHRADSLDGWDLA